MPKCHEFEFEWARVCVNTRLFLLKIKPSYKFFNRLEYFMDGRSILINLILIRYTRVVFDYYYWVYGSLLYKTKAEKTHTHLNHWCHKVNVFREFTERERPSHSGCAFFFQNIDFFLCCSFICFMLVWRTNGSEWNSLYQKAPSSPNGNGSRLHIHHTTPNRNSILLMDNY